MGVKIGIDLGTTNTLVVYEQKGKLKNIKFQGSTNLRSIVFYDENGVIVGTSAKQKGIIHPERMIKSAKTHMGDANHSWTIDGKKINSTMVATEVLKEVKEKIIKKLKLDDGEEVEAVITVPAYFTSNQKDETKKAAVNAGIKPLKIITEPVAAAIAYGANLDSKEKLFIFDLGGGTFDTAILEADPETNDYRTIAVDGDHKLGGDDFDKKLFDYFLEKVKKDIGIDFSETPEDEEAQEKYQTVRANLLNLAEEVKIDLSDSDSIDAQILKLLSVNGKDYDFELTITKQEFEGLCKDLIDRIKNIVSRTIKESKISKDSIDRIVMVGGSSNLPFVAELLENEFGKEAHADEDLGNLVVKGAAIVALGYDGLGQSSMKLTEIISHSLGIEVVGNKFAPILKRGIKYPCEDKDTFTTTVDYQEKVSINVYEGEDENNLNNNEFYGGFELVGIEKEKAGVPQIEVTFAFDKDGILVVTAEDKTTKAIKMVEIKKGQKVESEGQFEKTDIALAIDLSGSMSGSRLIEAVKAGKILVEDILDFSSQQLAVVGFASRAEVVCKLTTDKRDLDRYMDSLLTDTNRYGGGTYMGGGIEKGMEALRYSENKKVIILVTDGEDGSSYSTLATAERARNNGVDIYAIGVYDADKTFLKRLTNDPKKYFILDNISELQKTFKTIINGLKHRS